MNKGKFYITTAIAYTSRKPHIGNSYEILMLSPVTRDLSATTYSSLQAQMSTVRKLKNMRKAQV